MKKIIFKIAFLITGFSFLAVGFFGAVFSENRLERILGTNVTINNPYGLMMAGAVFLGILVLVYFLKKDYGYKANRKPKNNGKDPWLDNL